MTDEKVNYKKILKDVNTLIEKLTLRLRKNDRRLDQNFYNIINKLNQLYEYKEIKENQAITTQIRNLLEQSDKLLANNEFKKPKDISLLIIDKMESLKTQIEIQTIKESSIDRVNAIRDLIYDKSNIKYLNLLLKEYEESNLLTKDDYNELVLQLVTTNLNVAKKYINKEYVEQSKVKHYQRSLEMILHYNDSVYLDEDMKLLIKAMVNNDKSFYTEKTQVKSFVYFEEVLLSMIDKEFTFHDAEHVHNLVLYPEKLIKIFSKYDKTSKKPDRRSLKLFKERYDFYKDKKDVSYLLPITIDGSESDVRDDAISISENEDGSFNVGLHISDVLAVIPHDHSIIKELHRFPKTLFNIEENLNVTMLPSSLIKEYLSLDEDQLRHVTSFYVKVSKNGIVYDNIEIKKEVLKVAKNYSYDNAQKILNRPNKNKKLHNKLLLFEKLNDKLNPKHKRDEFYDLLKLNKRFKTGEEIDFKTKTGEIVRNIVHVINTNVARIAFNEDIPFIYRIHSFDDNTFSLSEQEKIKVANMNLEDRTAYLSEKYPTPEYSLENKGHTGLNVDYYSHITSPIRRAVDIGNTLSIEKYILNNEKLKDVNIEDILQEIMVSINLHEMDTSRANKITRCKEKKLTLNDK